MVDVNVPATESPAICPACHGANPRHNIHCELCGSLLAPAAVRGAAVRSDPSIMARVLISALMFVTVSIVLALLVDRSGGTESTPTSSAAAEVVQSSPVPALRLITPSSVTASSELEDFHAEHLIDGNDESYWNDEGLRGVGALLVFEFDIPIHLAAIELVNVHNEAALRRNYRIKAYEIDAGDTFAPIRGQLRDEAAPQRIELGLMRTAVVTLRVTSTYPAEPHEGNVPFDELALAEVRFFGVDDR